MLYAGETPIHAIKYNQKHYMVMKYSGLINFSLNVELMSYIRITLVQWVFKWVIIHLNIL